VDFWPAVLPLPVIGHEFVIVALEHEVAWESEGGVACHAHLHFAVYIEATYNTPVAVRKGVRVSFGILPVSNTTKCYHPFSDSGEMARGVGHAGYALPVRRDTRIALV